LTISNIQYWNLFPACSPSDQHVNYVGQHHNKSGVGNSSYTDFLKGLAESLFLFLNLTALAYGAIVGTVPNFNS
jgi:hypothetical protein